MPDPDTVRTDNPEVVRLLMAHEIAKAAASLSVDAYNRGARTDVEKYLAVFDTVYTAIRATAGPAARRRRRQRTRSRAARAADGRTPQRNTSRQVFHSGPAPPAGAGRRASRSSSRRALLALAGRALTRPPGA